MSVPLHHRVLDVRLLSIRDLVQEKKVWHTDDDKPALEGRLTTFYLRSSLGA